RNGVVDDPRIADGCVGCYDHAGAGPELRVGNSANAQAIGLRVDGNNAIDEFHVMLRANRSIAVGRGDACLSVVRADEILANLNLNTRIQMGNWEELAQNAENRDASQIASK